MAKPEVKTEKTKEYILKAGYEHNGFDAEGDRHVFVGGQKGNDRVQLSEDQAKALSDRFESVEEMEERLSLQNENARLRERQDEIAAKLAEKGMSLDDLLNSIDTAKKPNPPIEETNKGVAPQGGPSQDAKVEPPAVKK